MSVASHQASEHSPLKRQALDLFARLPHEYDEMGALLSFGQDPRWRRAVVDAVQAKPGDRLLDVATGTGLVAELLVRRYGSSVIGIDQSQEMLARARRRVTSDAELAPRVVLRVGEAERLPFRDGEFDGLTVAYLFRYVDDLGATLSELARVVKEGGVIASMDFGVPTRPPARALWDVYTRHVMPAAARVVSRGWYDVTRFLSWSIPDFYERFPLERQVELWRAAGIQDVRVRRMSFGAGVVISGRRRSVGAR
jgi:demethylmenaquinone methyltransferase / 2-methoxy-6-polyprenyl-1,4-benzoquinol methylase